MPYQRVMPRIAKMPKKKIARTRIPPSWTMEERRVVTRSRIDLRVERERRGRKSRKVRRTETF